MTPERNEEITYVVINLMRSVSQDQFLYRIIQELKQKGISREEYESWKIKRFPDCPNCSMRCCITFKFCPGCGSPLILLLSMEELASREKELRGQPHVNHDLQKRDGLNFCVDCGKKL